MPKWTNRTCQGCGEVSHTASKALLCIPCQRSEKKKIDEEQEKTDLVSWGYTLVSGPAYDRFKHRTYIALTPCCGNRYEFVFNNLRKQVKQSQENGTPSPCGTCGPKHRMRTALAGYVEKNGIDYDLDKANDYRRLVRRMTEQTYKHNKHRINPNNLPRGRNTGYHIDHKVPIIKAFKEGWTPEQCAAVPNLEMLQWQDNLAKGSK